MQFPAHDFGLDHFTSRPFNCVMSNRHMGLHLCTFKLHVVLKFVYVVTYADLWFSVQVVGGRYPHWVDRMYNL